MLSLLISVHPGGFFSIAQVHAQTTTGPSQLAFTTPAQTVAFGFCSSIIIVQTQNSTGSPSNVAPATTVFLVADSSTGIFYSDSACTTTITSTTIAAGSNSASFFYKDTTVGTPTISYIGGSPWLLSTVTITGSAAGLISASQVENIVPKIAVNPTATVGLNYVSGSIFSVDINVTDAPVMNSFRVSVQYNPKVLQALGIDYTSSSSYVLGQSPSVSFECIDEVSQVGGACTTLDDIGVATFWATLVGADTGGTTSGPLFSMTFKVLQPGFSNIHFLDARVVYCPSSASSGCVAAFVRSVNFDGYFSDITCNGALCTPPVARVTYSPSIVLTGKPVLFNANESYATNPGATIVNYTFVWDSWGEGKKATSNSTILHTFANGKDGTFTLVVNDTYGITGILSIPISVLSVYISVGVGSVNITPLSGVTPGTPVNIVVRVVNHSTQNENVSLHIILDPGGSQMKDLQDKQFFNMTASTYASPLTVVWDTTNYVPRIYPVTASVDPVINQTDISGLTTVAYVQLVSPQSTSGLSLTVVSGIGVAVSLALLFGLGSLGRIFRKKPFDEDVV